ncbi:response regulator transcription factor [Rhodobacter capsulatus]|uniref:response regulator transcription factor n=1 Tax=Rhodobacter capsulatus TaxID=1061 RepID=UPI0018E3F464|nr:response regulator transcription factor [Rhodobacter capsulatus]
MAHPLRMASGQAGDLCAPVPRCGLVIDDHPMIHLGCRQMLADAGFDEILTASSAEEGLALARSRQPDLAVLDLNLPEAGGMESIAPLLRACPGLRILVFTMNDRPAFAARVLEQGAHGFLSKNAPPASFRAAVAAITRGEVWLDHDTAMRLVTRRGLSAESPLAGLTLRERTVLFRLGDGLDLTRIATELNVSYKTAANTSAALKRKLAARGLNDLIRIAIENAGERAL